MILLLLISCAQDHYIPYPYEKYDTGIIEEEDVTEPATEEVEEVEEEPEPEEPTSEPTEEPVQEPSEEDTEDEVEEDTGYEEIEDEEPEVIDPNDIDDDGDGFTENDGDCDDTDPSTNPGSFDDTEDFIDNDCDGLVDEDYIPPVVDLYEYGGDYTLVGGSHWPEAYYAVDYGYTEIDSDGTGRTYFVCGLLNGYVDCFCYHNGSYNQCGTYTSSDYIPFQQFESLSVGGDSICTLDSSGVGLCWDGDGDFFNVPAASDPYMKVLSLSEHYMCALTEGGSLYCFDTATGGLIYSDSNTYKDIDGGQQSLTGVLSDGLTIEYIEPLSGYTSTNTPGYEILGMGAGSYAYCYGGIDQNGMQTVDCYERYPISQNNNSYTTNESCLPSAPHHYYYQFLAQGTDLMNIEVTDGKWAGIHDPVTNTTALWGGYWTQYMGSTNYGPVVSSGEWTGSGCNYSWGN